MKYTLLFLLSSFLCLPLKAQMDPVSTGVLLLQGVRVVKAIHQDRVGNGDRNISYIIHNGDSIPVMRVPKANIKGMERTSVLFIQTTLTEAKAWYLANDMEKLETSQGKFDRAKEHIRNVELIKPKWNISSYKEEIAFYESLLAARKTKESFLSDLAALNKQMRAQREVRSNDSESLVAPAQQVSESTSAYATSSNVIANSYRYVNASTLNLREEPSASGSVLETLKAKQKVEVLDKQGAWTKVQVLDKVGYLSSAYLVSSQVEVTATRIKANPSKPAISAKTSYATHNRPGVASKKGRGVYYCASGNVVKYHSSAGCRGLKLCRASIDPIPLSEAKAYMNPCKICY